jgi:transposase
LFEPHLLWRAGAWGGNARDNQLFIKAVLWNLRTGDLPPDYGNWSNTHRRFIRWRDKGIWEGLLAKMVQQPDFEWLMMMRRIVKFTITRRAQSAAIRRWVAQKGLNTKAYLAVDAYGLPLRVMITKGTVADYKKNLFNQWLCGQPFVGGSGL